MRSSALGFYGIWVAALATSRSDLAAAPELAAREVPVRTLELSPIVAKQCSLVVTGSRRLTTPDGRIVHVGVQTAAMRGGDVLIAGTFAYTWPAGSGHDEPPNLRDSIIGAVLDSAGRVALVPHPLPGRHVLHPRAVAAGHTGWHVLFAVSPTKDADGHVPPSERVALWYGLFDGRHWTRVERAAHGLVGARFWPSMSSDVVAHGTELGFGFLFGTGTGEARSSDARGAHGIGLLRRRDARWHLDTLPTAPHPASVRLLSGARAGEWLVAFTGSFVGRDHSGRARFDRSLFVSTAGPAGWASTRTVMRSEPFLYALRAVRVGDGLLAAWVDVAPDGTVGGSVLRWLTIPFAAVTGNSATPLADAARADTAVVGTNEFTIASPASMPSTVGAPVEAVLIAREGLRRDRLRAVAFLGLGARARDLGSLQLPNHTAANLVAAEPGRYLLLTSEVAQIARRTDLPSAATVVHDLRLRCLDRRP